MPSIGYGTNKKTKHMMPDGFYKFTISNVKVGNSYLKPPEGTCIL